MSAFFRKHQGLIVASCLVGLVLSLYLSDPGTTENTSFFRKVVLNVYSPPLRAIGLLFKEARYLWNSYIFLIDTQKKLIQQEDTKTS